MASVLNIDAMGHEVLAECVTCLQQGLPLLELLFPGLPRGPRRGQCILAYLQPEANKFIYHAVQGYCAAVS